VGEIVSKRAGEAVESIWRRGRRHSTFTIAIGGGFYANVVDGVFVGFGLEPVAGPVLSAPVHRRPVLAWAAPIAGAAAAAGAVATGFVLRHRRAA